MPFYFITNGGKVELEVENDDCHCNGLYNIANYCTDKKIMQQRAIYETLNRLLWRYSMEHNGDKIRLNHCWGLLYSNGAFEARELYGYIYGECIFYDKSTAENAIKEIIRPFVKAHPDFKF